ncbi:TIGR02270 family protein [Archangium sp.]|uniref:TIGR02270 family protein n=1 Tax=Archangium sp. TaxID=1872627 RepID=UPI00389A4161
MSYRADLILNWDIYEEHLDEAAFFWGRWERSLSAPDEVLPEVVASEERLLARLDALVLGGDAVAERLLLPALASDEPERLASAAFALLCDGSSRRGRDAVLTALEDASPAVLTVLQRALELLDTAALPPWLMPVLLQRQIPLRALALDVLGAHAIPPELALADLLVEGEPRVSAAALRAAARLRVRLEPRVLQRFFSSSESTVRDAALVVGLLQGQRDAWVFCRRVVEARGRDLETPLLLLALGGDAGELDLLQGLLEVEALRPDVLWALGFGGRVSGAEACLELFGDERVGHLAAEAFCAITGLVLEGQYVSGEQPQTGEETAPEEPSSPLRHPEPGPGLPRAEVGAVRAWWTESRSRFNAHTRYLRGRPWTPAVLLQGLWTEPMRRRHVLALEAAFRSQGAVQLRTRTFARHQLAALELLRTAAPFLSSGPLVTRLSA